MIDSCPYDIHGILEKKGQPLRRIQAFSHRWIALFRESTLVGCHWELKDTRFWPKWLLAVVPLCLFVSTICVVGYGWQTIVMTKWHATSTYHRQLVMAAHSQKSSIFRQDEWLSLRKAIHRQRLTLLDRLSAPVSPMETLTNRAGESGLVLRHLMPLEKAGQQSYSLLLEGTFNGIMKFLLDPVGKSIWTIETMMIEFAAADSAIGGENHTIPTRITHTAPLGTQKTSIHGARAEETPNLPAKSRQLLRLAVVVSWIEPRLLTSALSIKQPDIPEGVHLTHTHLLNKSTALLNQLIYKGFDKPRLNPFEKQLSLSVAESRDMSLVTTKASALLNREDTVLHHTQVKVEHDYPELVFLGTFSDQRERKALVKAGKGTLRSVSKGEFIPLFKLRVIALDKHVLTLENADGSRVVKILKQGLRESVNHE